MSVPSFDSGNITFDSGLITWDAGLLAGTVSFSFATGGNLVVNLANVRTQEFQYDRRMFRSPYGSVWHQEGDFRRLVESITVQAHIVDDANGISDAAIDAGALAVALPSVVRVESAIGDWIVAALASYSRQPIESGYRFDIQFVTFDGIQ